MRAPCWRTCGRADLVAAARWLEEPRHLPPRRVCHGDLHPFNLLVDADGTVTVLDWSASLLAPVAYDVAFNGLVLSEPPVAVPRLFRPASVPPAGGSPGAFVAPTPVTAPSPSTEALRWNEGVVCLRVLTEVAHCVAADEVEARRGHPWLVSGPALATGSPT